MTINIFININPEPYGGGNQFLKALRDYFIEINIYEKNPELADVILFNSHHQFKELIKFKKKYPEKIFIHRIDGPVSLIRKNDKHTDFLIYKINNLIADASIFQSRWSKKENIKNGMENKKFETIILNAPNSSIFNTKDKKKFDPSEKTKIIATSWSHNMIKGFETYKWLDKNLDFSKYEMTFCGNSPLEFENINYIKPLPSNELAIILKQHDIYITASQKDPCSNSLIEALHCGLPAIGLNDGGHPEIIRNAGLIFNRKEEIPELLKEIKNNYDNFHENINLPKMENIGKKYFNFIEQVFLSSTSEIKKLKLADKLKLYKTLLIYKISGL